MICRWLLIFLMVVSFCAKADEYILDPNHTFVEWHINHFGFSTPSGKWMANGSLTFDEKKPKNGKVNVTINIKDGVTGIPELDKHLKSKLFFDADKFPQATFVSDKVEVSPDQLIKVHGTLTVHGVSQGVILNVKVNKKGASPLNDKETVGFSATTQVKRSQFGLNTLLPGLSDEVDLNIEAEGYRK